MELLRYYPEKYPCLPLTETSVRRLIKKQQKMKSQVASANAGNENPDAQPDCEVHKLPHKKN